MCEALIHIILFSSNKSDEIGTNISFTDEETGSESLRNSSKAIQM